MRFKVLGNFRTALTRQITEARRVRKREASVLNRGNRTDVGYIALPLGQRVNQIGKNNH